MAAQITADEVSALLAELGYSIPSVVLGLLLDQVNAIDECLDAAGQDDNTQKLIKLYAAALLAASSGARRIKSRGAPSGASQSFDYGEDGIIWLRDSLAKLDVHGCTAELPISAGGNVGFFMAVGGCR